MTPQMVYTTPPFKRLYWNVASGADYYASSNLSPQINLLGSGHLYQAAVATFWLAWENSWHLAMLPLVSLPNDVWETSAEIPYWWWWYHYPDLGSASDWFNKISHVARPIRSTTQIWVVTRHQYGISALVSQTSFDRETCGSVAKCRLFSQATFWLVQKEFNPFLSLLLCGHQVLDTLSLALF